MLKMVMNTAAGIIVICLIILRVQANDYDDFVSRTLLQNCPYTGTCSRSPQSVFKYDNKTRMPCCQQCSCENNCRTRGTCCYDKENYNFTQSHGNSSEKCLVATYPGNSTFNGMDEKYFTVTSCPVNRPIDEIVRLCEMPIPQTLEQVVLVSDDKGTIYRNMYCAQCNGVLDFTQWKAEVTCTMFDSTKPLNLDLQNILNSGCSVMSKMPDDFPNVLNSLCFDPDFTECNITGIWQTYDYFIDSACKSEQYGVFVQPVRYSFDVYKNFFCYLCNADIGPIANVCAFDSEYKSNGRIPFTAILNLRQNPGQHIETDEKTDRQDLTLRCGMSEIYDKYADTCRGLFCAIDSFVFEGQCVKKFDVTGGFGIRFCIGFQSKDQFTASRTESKDIVKEMSETTTLFKSLRKKGCTICWYTWNSEPSISNMTYVANFDIMVTAKCSINDIWKLAAKFDNSLVKIKSNNRTLTFYRYMLSKETINKPYILDNLNLGDALLFELPQDCRSTIFISLHEMICPRIQISGLDLVKGLELGYIRKNGQYLKHNLLSYGKETLANKTFEICLDDYVENEDYETAGYEGHCVRRVALLVFAVITVLLVEN